LKPDHSNLKQAFSEKIKEQIQVLKIVGVSLPSYNFSNYFSEDDEVFNCVMSYLKSIYPAFPPDYIFSYSNLGFELFGVVIERISNMPFCEYIERNILMPLGMHNSAASQSARLPDHSKAYEDSDAWGLPSRPLDAGRQDALNQLHKTYPAL